MAVKVRVYLVSIAFGFFLIGVVRAADSITLITAKQGAGPNIIADGTYIVDAANDFTNVEHRNYDATTMITSSKMASVDTTKLTWQSTILVAKATYEVYGRLHTEDKKTKITHYTDSTKRLSVKVRAA